MLVRDGHCAQCGIHIDKTRFDGFRMGSACPDPACPSHNRADWMAWFTDHEDLDFNFGPVDWVKLRAWVDPFKDHVRALRSLPRLDDTVLKVSKKTA